MSHKLIISENYILTNDSILLMAYEFGLSIPSQETEEFPIDQIALVRILDGPPRTVDGHFILETAFQRTQSGRSVNSIATVGQPKFPIPRITLHFSLNDCVADTTSGDTWIGSDYVVISSFQETLRKNPKAQLRNLLGGDTYFEVPPSEDFQLPSDTVLVKPGNPDYIRGIKQRSNIKIYKSMNFTEEDYLEVTKQLGERSITTRVLHHLDIHRFIPAFGSLYPPYDQVITDEGKFNDRFVVYCRQNGIDFPKAYSEIMDRLSRDHFKRKAVHEVLLEKGYRVLPSGDDAWNEPGMDHRLKETAGRLGVTSKRHFGTIDYDLEKMLIGFQSGEIARSEIELFIQSHKKELTAAQTELLKYLLFDADKS